MDNSISESALNWLISQHLVVKHYYETNKEFSREAELIKVGTRRDADPSNILLSQYDTEVASRGTVLFVLGSLGCDNPMANKVVDESEIGGRQHSLLALLLSALFKADKTKTAMERSTSGDEIKETTLEEKLSRIDNRYDTALKSLHWQTNDNLEKSVKASENIVKRLEDRNNDSREHRSISVTINNRDLGLEKENKALLDQIECLHKEINKVPMLESSLESLEKRLSHASTENEQLRNKLRSFEERHRRDKVEEKNLLIELGNHMERQTCSKLLENNIDKQVPGNDCRTVAKDSSEIDNEGEYAMLNEQSKEINNHEMASKLYNASADQFSMSNEVYISKLLSGARRLEEERNALTKDLDDLLIS